MNVRNFCIAMLMLSIGFVSCKNNKAIKLKSGLEYKILKKSKSGKKITVGSIITMNVITKLKDSVLFDTYTQNNKQPVQVNVTLPSFNGDLMEALPKLEEGDSVLFKVPVDSMARGGELPPYFKKGDKLDYYVKIESVKSVTEFQDEQAKADSKQGEIDQKLIEEFVAANKLQTQKTETGIHYIIEKKGNGKHPVASDKVKVHYKGTLLDGTTFDSSYDKGEPVEFPLAQVIPGWIEGIPLLEVGGKGKLIIPSSLAYGKNAPPNSPIKPNSILVFDIELLDIVK